MPGAGKLGRKWVDMYHGSIDPPMDKMESRPIWMHEDPKVADSYATESWMTERAKDSPHMMPLKIDPGRINYATQEDIIDAAVRQGTISRERGDKEIDNAWMYIDENWTGRDSARATLSDLAEQGFDAARMTDQDLHGNIIESTALFDPRRMNDIGALKGRFTDKLAVPGVAAGALASQESEAMPIGRMYGEDEELDEETVATLDRIRNEPPGIYGPQHPRMLAGIDAVRGIPGADFVGGGVLDLASEYAWGRNPSMGQHAMAGLEIGGGALGGMVGRMASKVGRATGLGRMADDAIENVSDTAYMDEIIADADYPDITTSDADIIDSIREQFQKGMESSRMLRNERSSFATEYEAQAARRAKENPTAWIINPTGRSGYQLESYSGGQGRQAIDAQRR